MTPSRYGPGRIAGLVLCTGLIFAGGGAGVATENPAVAAPRPPGDGTVEVGKPYFDFTAPTLTGGEVSLASVLEHKAVLLQFWSITCVPCLEEIPFIARLQAEYGGADFLALGVNIDNGGAARLRAAMEARGVDVPYTVVLDPERAVSANYAPWAVPVTVLIDRTGEVRSLHPGYKPALEPVIESAVREVLGR